MPTITPVHNPRLRYTLVRPNKTRQGQMVRFIGWFADRQAFVDQQLHGQPLGTTIEDLRQVDRHGRDLPKQPNILLQSEPRTADLGTVKATRTAVAGSPHARAVRPKVLRASDQSHALAEDNGDDVYPGVVPYAPPPGSEDLDYDAPDAPEPLGLEPPDPEQAVDDVPNADQLERDRAAARAGKASPAAPATSSNPAPPPAPPATDGTPRVVVKGEPRAAGAKPPTDSKG